MPSAESCGICEGERIGKRITKIINMVGINIQTGSGEIVFGSLSIDNHGHEQKKDTDQASFHIHGFEYWKIQLNSLFR